MEAISFRKHIYSFAGFLRFIIWSPNNVNSKDGEAVTAFLQKLPEVSTAEQVIMKKNDQKWLS